MASAVSDQIAGLEAARQLVLSDASLYTQVVPGILPIIGAGAHLDIRRWGADFLAEAFASPAIALQAKESLSIQVLGTLNALLEVPLVDEAMVKSVIQAAASVYGLVFRYITYNQYEATAWSQMTSIKLNILKRWDTATIGVRICCIKFAQRVVQVQTPGVISDPRRPEQNEISLALVPRNHPIIPPPNLEAEASGLLDRLLNVFYEEHSDAILINATLNCLGVLVRTRSSIANKIVNTVLSFNPLKKATAPPIASKLKVQIKSMERTVRVFLMGVLKRNQNNPLAPRISQHIDRLQQSRMDMFDGSRKRGSPADHIGADNAKRARMASSLKSQLPPGPISPAQLYTMTTEEGLRSFDVTALPTDLVAQITVPILRSIDQNRLAEAIKVIQSRLLSLEANQHAIAQASPAMPTTAGIDDEDEYEPDFEPMEDTEQLLNKSDILPSEEMQKEAADLKLELERYELPKPKPMTPDEAIEMAKFYAVRVFNLMASLPYGPKRPQQGWVRTAASTFDKAAWATILTRLATRGPRSDPDDVEAGEGSVPKGDGVANFIREMLWKWIVEDFRVHFSIAMDWLVEEYWCEACQFEERTGSMKRPDGSFAPTPTTHKWALKLLDAVIPYLDAKDHKWFTRFWSESPIVTAEMLERVKAVARDPERTTMAVNSLYFLVLFRPPARELALDALEDLWRTDEGAKKLAAKYLGKYRPEILDSKPDPLKDHVPGKDEKAMASISIRAGSAAESRGLNGGSQAPSTITAE